MVKVNPSALAEVCWKLKSVTKLWILTGVAYQAVRASPGPPSVSCSAPPLMVALFRTSPVPVKLDGKLMVGGATVIVYAAAAKRNWWPFAEVTSAMALKVSVAACDADGSEYTVDDAVGAVPLVV